MYASFILLLGQAWIGIVFFFFFGFWVTEYISAMHD